jgi:hypothetical protein
VGGDDVAQVCHGRGPKDALGSLDEEDMAVQFGEDDADVPQVICPSLAINQYIIKKDKDEPMKKWTKHVVHECLECGWGVA